MRYLAALASRVDVNGKFLPPRDRWPKYDGETYESFSEYMSAVITLKNMRLRDISIKDATAIYDEIAFLHTSGYAFQNEIRELCLEILDKGN